VDKKDQFASTSDDAIGLQGVDFAVAEPQHAAVNFAILLPHLDEIVSPYDFAEEPEEDVLDRMMRLQER